jgi:hypothetical protein
MNARRIKPTKNTKKTILIVGEGETEKAFLQHLKELLVSREADFVVKVECGSGGGPKGVVQKTIRLRSSRAYDKCFVLVDADRPFEPDSKLEERMRKKPRVEMLKSTPCVEGLLLAVLQHRNFSQTSTTSDYCKREFETNYIPADKKTDKRAYAERFTEEVVRNRRATVVELEAILRAMQV